jgi:hypothetical protein
MTVDKDSDLRNAITELECGNGVLTLIIRIIDLKMDGNEERWPDIQRLPDWCFEATEN